jgi:hypothetical protein
MIKANFVCSSSASDPRDVSAIKLGQCRIWYLLSDGKPAEPTDM